ALIGEEETDALRVKLDRHLHRLPLHAAHLGRPLPERLLLPFSGLLRPTFSHAQPTLDLIEGIADGHGFAEAGGADPPLFPGRDLIAELSAMIDPDPPAGNVVIAD